MQKGEQMKDLIERQAAIDAMCSACGYDCDKSEFVYNAPQDKQVIMCPEHYALTVLPPAQSDVSSTNVGDTISRQAAIDALAELQGRASTKAELKGISKAWKRIKKLPSAQPDIIRCNDCKYWDTTWQNDYAPNYHYCPMIDGTRRNDFYCAYAERKEETT